MNSTHQPFDGSVGIREYPDLLPNVRGNCLKEVVVFRRFTYDKCSLAYDRNSGLVDKLWHAVNIQDRGRDLRASQVVQQPAAPMLPNHVCQIGGHFLHNRGVEVSVDAAHDQISFLVVCQLVFHSWLLTSLQKKSTLRLPELKVRACLRPELRPSVSESFYDPRRDTEALDKNEDAINPLLRLTLSTDKAHREPGLSAIRCSRLFDPVLDILEVPMPDVELLTRSPTLHIRSSIEPCCDPLHSASGIIRAASKLNYHI